MPKPRTLVVGPAYLDRVLRVDRPLIEPDQGGVLDRSVSGLLRPPTGTGKEGDRSSDADADRSLLIRCVPDHPLLITPLPEGWPGPTGVVESNTDHVEAPAQHARCVEGIEWQDDLGGMGAGYAGALGGRLVWIAGASEDPVTTAVAKLLHSAEIENQALRVPDRAGEWTLLLTSGRFGDKLAVGIRTMGNASIDFDVIRGESCDLLVAASMTNARASAVFEKVASRIRFFAPSIRNMTDRDPPVSTVCRHVDIISCNSLEWNSLEDREQAAWQLSLLLITDGPRGATIRFTDEVGEPGLLQIPSFPRLHPPRDTNRAGEAFGSAFVQTLIDNNWQPGISSRSLVQAAAERASIAAALVLDRVDFGFPTRDEIDRARLAGLVG